MRTLLFLLIVTPAVLAAKEYHFSTSTISGHISEAQAISIHRFITDWNSPKLSQSSEKTCLSVCLDEHRNISEDIFPLYMEFTTKEYSQHLINRHKRLFSHENQAIWCLGKTN